MCWKLQEVEMKLIGLEMRGDRRWSVKFFMEQQEEEGNKCLLENHGSKK